MRWTQSDADISLSQREMEIIELVAHGYSAKEIAGRLQIAPRTVEGHIDVVRLKMRARNRVHMITKAIVAGHLRLGTAVQPQRLCAECLFKPEESPEASPEHSPEHSPEDSSG